MITQTELKSLLHYDPDTGLFTWLVNKSSRAMKGTVASRTSHRRYIRICIDGKDYFVHRLAFLYMTGKFPINKVDHENGVRNDNRWLNIKNATDAENSKNRKISSNNTSGIAGVRFVKSREHYIARTEINGVNFQLAYTRDFFEACCARKSAELKFGFHINHGRIS